MKSRLTIMYFFALLSLFGFNVSSQEQSTTNETETETVSQIEEQLIGREEAQNAQQANETLVSAEAINPIQLSYSISSEDETFISDIEEAFMTWQDASVGAIVATQSAESDIVFEGADSSLLGPDVLTLKLDSRDLSEDIPRTERKILVVESIREISPNLYKSALLNEVGVLVGLPLTGAGVMQRGLTEEIVPEVSVGEARALEQQATAAKEDLNRNGTVDFYDLVELAKNYTDVPQNYSADLTGDGTVNDEDVNQLRELYEFSDPVDADAPEVEAQDSVDESNETADNPESESLTSPESASPEPISPEDVSSDVVNEEVQDAAQENESNSTDENLTQESSETESSPPEDSSGGQ